MNRLSPSVDVLEGRQLLSGPTAELTGGVLKLEGGEGFTDVSIENFGENQIVAFIGEEVFFFDAEKVKIVQFSSSKDGQDRFFNFTDKKSISRLSGEYNVVVTGFYHDIVIDDGNFTYLDSANGGKVNYVSTNPDGELLPV